MPADGLDVDATDAGMEAVTVAFGPAQAEVPAASVAAAAACTKPARTAVHVLIDGARM